MISTMSSVRNSNLALAALGGVVLGGAFGAAITAAVLRRTKDDGEEDGLPRNKQTSPSKNKSRSLDFGGDAEDRDADSALKHVDDGTHVNFLSDVLSRLWPYVNKAGSEMIRSTVEPMFADLMPGPMKSLKFTKIDLGSVPMVLDNVIVHELDTRDGSVQFDWDVIWNSSSDIQLAADYGIAFGVRTISLRGRMSFLLKPLSNEIPCVDAITYTFINPPELELDFTGLANVADFSVVTRKIRGILQDVLASMMVLPVRMMYKMAPSADFGDIYTPLKGVARVKLHGGRNFRVEKQTLRAHDVPDVYCVIRLGCEEPWKTPTVKDSLSPVWTDASHDFVLSDNDQILNIDVYDEDSGAMDSDDFLGRCQVTVARLLLAPDRKLELEVCQKKPKGNWTATGSYLTLSVDVLPFAVTDHSSLTTTNENASSELTGLLTVLVNQAHNLPVAKVEAGSFVKVVYGNVKADGGDSFKELGVNGVVTDLPGYDALNPVYEMPFHLPLSRSTVVSQKHPDVKLQLINKEDTLGEIIVTHEELLAADGGIIRETRPIGGGGASLSFAVSLAGVGRNRPADVGPGAGGDPTEQAPTPASPDRIGAGMVRVAIVKGSGFQVRKRGPFKRKDVPDIYCVVRYGSDPQPWRTPTVKNSVAPSWGAERRDYPYGSPNQAINVDVFDENKRTKDDFCGTARTTVGKVLLTGGGQLDVEVVLKGNRTGLFVTVGCSLL